MIVLRRSLLIHSARRRFPGLPRALLHYLLFPIFRFLAALRDRYGFRLGHQIGITSKLVAPALEERAQCPGNPGR